MGLPDPRLYGSGNPGATNVFRSGHKIAAILTLVGDTFKGWFAVWLTVHSTLEFNNGAIALAAIAVFLGHLYPVFFRFKGGKGVATAIGVLWAINPTLGFCTTFVWIIVAFFFRYSSLAALVVAILAPFFDVLLMGVDVIALAVLGMSVLLIWRHQKNITKLLASTESQFSEKTRDVSHARKRILKSVKKKQKLHE